ATASIVTDAGVFCERKTSAAAATTRARVAAAASALMALLYVRFPLRISLYIMYSQFCKDRKHADLSYHSYGTSRSGSRVLGRVHLRTRAFSRSRCRKALATSARSCRRFHIERRLSVVGASPRPIR